MHSSTHQQNAGGVDKPDYVDKAFAAGAKKFGGSSGERLANDRATSEKIVSIDTLSICLSHVPY